MRLWAVTALLACGCTRVVVIEANMPPLLLPEHGPLERIAIGRFTVSGKTPPALAQVAADALADAVRKSPAHRLAPSPAQAQMIVSGVVYSGITEGTARRPDGTLKTRTADVSVTLTGTAGRTMRLLTVTEYPAVEDKGRFQEALPDADALQSGLVQACVQAFVRDVSPRRIRVPVPRPVVFGDRHTRRGIDRLATDPAGAVVDLTEALAANPNDAAALNALGLCSELAGNLELAVSGYTYAAAIDPRPEYQQNMRRAHDLLERRNALLNPPATPRRPR